MSGDAGQSVEETARRITRDRESTSEVDLPWVPSVPLADELGDELDERADHPTVQTCVGPVPRQMHVDADEIDVLRGDRLAPERDHVLGRDAGLVRTGRLRDGDLLIGEVGRLRRFREIRSQTDTDTGDPAQTTGGVLDE